MIEAIAGAAVLFGLLGLFRVGRRARCHHHGHPGHHRRWRRGGRRHRNLHRVAGEVLKRHLDIDEDQEGIVDHAVADLRESLEELSHTLRDSRPTLADAFRGEAVDDAALQATFARHDEELARTRRQVVSALKQIHAVLDDEQRARAAEWIAEGRLGR